MRITGHGGILINATSSGYGPVSYGYMLGIQGGATQSYMSMNYAGGALDTQGMVFGVDSIGGVWLHRENKALRLYTNNTERITVQGGGDVIINNKAGIGTTLPYSRLSVGGVIENGGAYLDPNFTSTTTGSGMSLQSGGSLSLMQGWVGSYGTGDTIVFKYEATSWKSWQLEWSYSAAYGFSKGSCGGYNNNSMSAYYNSETNQGSNVNISVAATNIGQHVIVTFSGALGIHPCMKLIYTQSGGDGAPRSDRASLTFNS